MSDPTHICIDCGALGHAGGYHDHGNGAAGDTISLEVLRKQWSDLSYGIEHLREDLRAVVNSASLITFNSREITVRLPLDHWASVLLLAEWYEEPREVVENGQTRQSEGQ